MLAVVPPCTLHIHETEGNVQDTLKPETLSQVKPDCWPLTCSTSYSTEPSMEDPGVEQ